MTTVALIVAAGRGSRLAADRPKQYLPLAGESLLRRSLAAFLSHPSVDAIQVVIHPRDRAAYDKETQGLSLPEPVAGGASRQESVRLGLEALARRTTPPARVLIHDAARPFVDAALIDRVLAALNDAAGAVPGLALVDSLKRVEACQVVGSVERAGLWRVQTPQGFRFPAILDAHRVAAETTTELTDDAGVAEAAGLSVRMVEGSPANEKITTPADLERATAMISSPSLELRIGQGFDVHRVDPGKRGLVLCGLTLPEELALSGHSDADVGLHALTDAILGGLALGDIGQRFPPSDPQWKGADSSIFLADAGAAVRERGGEIRHLDVTIICERPKVGPHREAMRRRIADILALPISRVSVKATTTERLGFTGRGEGIAAQAVATLALPPEIEGTEMEDR